MVDYYEGDVSLLESAVVQSVRSADAILEARMALTMMGERDKEFAVCALGSSVTAGHDAFKDTSYPAVMERVLKPIWDKLDVKFEVRNQAVGGRDPNPWPFCLAAMCGEDVDVVMREWEYWSFNDGVDADRITVEGKDSNMAAIEVLLRNVLLLERQPSLHFLRLSHQKKFGSLDWMKQWLSPKGELKDYKGFSILGFDHFGKGFGKLRKAMPTKRRTKNNESECSGEDIGDCPVDIEKQDGYHTQAAYNGYSLKHPAAEHLAKAAAEFFGGVVGSMSSLFINWHPAPLGHEVMGNQIAYYHLGIMEKALGKLIKGADAFDIEPDAAIQPIPAASQCRPEVCTFLGDAKPKCAYAYLPRSEDATDVMDMMVNATGVTPKWVHKAVRNPCADKKKEYGALDCDSPPLVAAGLMTGGGGGPTDDGRRWFKCLDKQRACSYADTKRGVFGTSTSGPIVFKISPDMGMYHCKIWLGEPGYEWSKPRDKANWRHELEVKVNNITCTPPECTISQKGYLQSMVIDARAVLGGKCRRIDVLVSIEVKPVAQEAVTCKLNNDNNCETSETWKGYQSSGEKGICVNDCGKHPRKDAKDWLESGMRARESYKKRIGTFISHLITF